jgi:hypothetical protein
VITGTKVPRPLKEKMAADIAALRGLPDPKVSNGSSVESLFLDAVYASIAGAPSGCADTYRKTEALLERLALSYDPYWDTSEAAPTGGGTVPSLDLSSGSRVKLPRGSVVAFWADSGIWV